VHTFNIEGLTEDGLRRPLQPEACCLPLQRRGVSPKILLKVRCVVLPPPHDANGLIVGDRVVVAGGAGRPRMMRMSEASVRHVLDQRAFRLRDYDIF
jgi:hypothetical protein